MRYLRTVSLLVFSLAVLPTSGLAQGVLPSASPESVGISSERLARVDALFDSYITKGQMAGVIVAIARKGKLVHFQTLGRMDMDEDRPMREDAIFRMASMTKPITSVAVRMLYEEGRFQLEDPVSWYIPEFAGMRPEASVEGAGEAREMTVRDLLTHTAGMPGNGDSQYSEITGNRELSLQEIMEGLGKLPLAYPPGTEWRYSQATSVVVYLVEAVSGMPFEQFLSERIFQMLGMPDTGFFVPESKGERVASLYAVSSEGVTEERWSGLRPEETRPPKGPRGAGGLFSTASDYRFSQMLLTGGELDGVRILGRKTVELMTTDHLPPGVRLPERFSGLHRLAGYGFGLGVRVRTDMAESQALGSIGEYGWGRAQGTYFLVDPHEELVAMFLPPLVLCSQSLFRFADLGDDGLCRGGPDKGCGVIVSAIDVVVDRLD